MPKPLWVHALCVVLVLAPVWPPTAGAQQRPQAVRATPAVPPGPGGAAGPELIAVLELEAVDASKGQASAMTDRLREELLATGRFTLVNREQTTALLNEQALQQTGCTSEECAVEVGRMLGVQQIVAGRVTRLDDTHWLLAATLTDVESARTLRAESVRHEGSFFTLLDGGIGVLAAKLAGTPPQGAATAAAPLAPPPQVEPESGSSWLWWVFGALLVGGGAASQSGQAAASPTTTLNVSW